MTTMNKSLVAKGEFNKKTVGTNVYTITDNEESAMVHFHFKPIAGITNGSSVIVRMIPTDAHINDDVAAVSAAYLSSSQFVCNFAPDNSVEWKVSQAFYIPPGYDINIVDASGSKISVFVFGTKFRNFVN